MRYCFLFYRFFLVLIFEKKPIVNDTTKKNNSMNRMNAHNNLDYCKCFVIHISKRLLKWFENLFLIKSNSYENPKNTTLYPNWRTSCTYEVDK
jgi:hypothetical protein